jgi:ATP phosphoribosyltransferase regulatory subunit HisZ
MPRTRRVIPLEEKIKKAEEKVTSTKQKYEAALEELKDLLDKQKAIQNESLLNLFAKSKKSYDEIVAFLSEGEEENTDEE